MDRWMWRPTFNPKRTEQTTHSHLLHAHTTLTRMRMRYPHTRCCAFHVVRMTHYCIDGCGGGGVGGGRGRTICVLLPGTITRGARALAVLWRACADGLCQHTHKHTHVRLRICSRVCVFKCDFPTLRSVCVCVCTTMDRNIFRSNASSDPNRPTLSELKGFALDVRY